ncbi:unnamed protein product [Rotaria sordida]|nr:unnamed protein product [Rotaria sordida]
MNSSSNMSLQLSGLQRLAQLMMNAGGTNHITVDSLVHSLQSLGFVDPHIREIIQSITTLINYGLITIENPSRTNIYSPTGSTHHQMFSTSHNNNYSLSQRDRQDNYSRNSTDMDYKRFKSDQQRTTKTKR